MYTYIGFGIIAAAMLACRKRAQSSMGKEQNNPPPDIAKDKPPVTDISPAHVDPAPPPSDFDPLAIDPMPQPQKGKRKRK